MKREIIDRLPLVYMASGFNATVEHAIKYLGIPREQAECISVRAAKKSRLLRM